MNTARNTTYLSRWIVPLGLLVCVATGTYGADLATTAMRDGTVVSSPPLVVNYGAIASKGQTLCSPGTPRAIDFNTLPSGAASFGYQWFFRDGDVAAPTGNSTVGWTAIPGATGMIVTPAPGLTVTRTFTCFVSPAGAEARFAAGKHTIDIKPSFSSLGSISAGNQTLAAPANPSPIVLSVTPPPAPIFFAYRWFFRNGVQAAPAGRGIAGWTVIPGATGATYDPPAGLLETRSFACFVDASDSSCGPRGNFAAGVRVITVSNVLNYGTIAVAEQGACTQLDGTPITLSTLPSGAPSFTYQWFSSAGVLTPPASNNTAGWTRINGATVISFDPPAGATATKSFACLVTPSNAPARFATGKGVVKIFALNDIQHGTVQFSFPFALANPADPAPIPFTSQPSGASGVFAFQWFFKNGQNEVPATPSTAGWTAIPGATSSTFDPEAGLSVTRTFACFTSPVPLCAGFTGNWASNKCVIVIR